MKAIFNKELVKTGMVDKQNGKLFNQLFGLRQEADYEDFSPIEKEDVESLIPKVEVLIAAVEEIINNSLE